MPPSFRRQEPVQGKKGGATTSNQQDEEATGEDANYARTFNRMKINTDHDDDDADADAVALDYFISGFPKPGSARRHETHNETVSLEGETNIMTTLGSDEAM